MLRRVLSAVSRKIKKLTMAETSSQLQGNEDGKGKRPLDDKETDEEATKKIRLEPAAPMQGRADRKRKVALLLAYCGAGYYGLQFQKNGDFKTVESELIKALVAAEVIPPDHAETPSKMSFQRASRTDKNVSAVGNVISLKMLFEDTVCEKINTHLPPEIRAVACMRTTRGFDSKHHCTARTYKYMLPTYSFAPFEKFVTKDYRLQEGTIQKVNEFLAKYKGTHNFHNFTSGRKPNDSSTKRYIMSFECGEPFVRDGMEFAVLTVTGQSFMLHHIRKMIGLTIAVVRGCCGDDVLEKSWGPLKIDIPKAPGLGLFLDQLFFNGYNKKFGSDGMHEPLKWDKYQEALDQFREEHVLSHICRSELEESVMLRWLGTLQFHKFDVIDEQQDMPPDGEKEKDVNWWKTVRLLREMDKARQQEKEDSAAVQTSVTTTTSEEAVPTGQTEESSAADAAKETTPDRTVATTTGNQTECSTSSQDPRPSPAVDSEAGSVQDQTATNTSSQDASKSAGLSDKEAESKQGIAAS